MNYGIFGFGNAGKVHARVLSRKHPDIDLYIFDTDESQLRHALELLPNSKVYRTIEDLSPKEKLTAASICTPHDTHSILTCELAGKGIHILCEKPIATNIHDAGLMIETCNDSDVILSCIFQHRYEPAIILLKESIEDGDFGDIISTSISVKWSKLPDYYKNRWQGSKLRAGGGVAINQAIHMIDLATWLNNGVHSVYAKSINERSYIDVEDNLTAVIEFLNGAIGTFDLSTSAKKSMGTSLEVIGTLDSIRIHEGQVVSWASKTPLDISEINKSISLIDKDTWGKRYFGSGHIFQIDNFISAVKGNESTLVDGQSALNTLKVVMCLYESMDSKLEVLFK